MAKMKVHELAKELEIQSKEIITYLKEKGMEVKAAQSSIEDEAIALVRGRFKTGGKDVETTAKEAALVTDTPAERKTVENTPAAEKKVMEKEEKAAAPEKAGAGKSVPERRPAAENAKAEEPPKKKKKIIIINNSGNSKMQGNRNGDRNADRGGRDRRPQGQGQGRPQSQNRPQGNGARPVSAANPFRPLIKPSVKPQPVTNDYGNRNRMQNNSNKPAASAPSAPKEEAVKPAVKAAAENTAAAGKEIRQSETPRTNNGERRSEQRNGERREFQNRERNDGRERQGNRLSGSGKNEGRRNEGQNRPGYQNGQKGQTGSASGNKPFNNSGRGARPDSRNQAPGKRGGQGKGFAMDTQPAPAEKRPQDEKRRGNQDRDKRSRKDMIYEEEEKTTLKNKAGRFIKPEKKEAVVEEQIKVITLPEKLTIKELADKMKMQPSAIIKKLFLAGQIVTLNTEVSYEEAENIAIEYDIICEKEVQVDVIEELLKEEEEDVSKMVKRPPVVCVMGHVDHGKTSLLDAIRKTNVTDKEAGGITQAIGAYTVNVNNAKITFLDTPGHEAFTAMRMRGANATDIAILVIAADDGVKPQTIEAINHAKAAGVEIIVAVNKIDKPTANVEKVKQELMEFELVPTDWGGSTEFVPVSAKSGEGIEDLLETILLTAEIMELKANKKRKARGLVIEAELDKGRGPVATVLVQKGTLKIGDFVSAGASYGKVRAMIDDKGKRVKEAGPSMPVEILGLSDVPAAGEVFLAHESDKTAKSYAETYLSQHKEQMLADTRVRMSLDDLFSQIKEGDLKELNLVVKADVQGSVEAVKQSLLKLSNEEVVVKCIHGGVGAINESDVTLASASNAIIIGFNVKPDAQAKATAEREKVDVRLYDVIYKAIEDVERAMKGMLAPVYEEKVIGHAEVRQIFKASAVGNIAGSYVLDGEFKRDSLIRITREGEQIYEGKLASLKRFKDDVKEVRAGFECGLVFEGFDQMQELDIVEAYIMVEVPRE